jgi:hypothetical protein
VVTPLGPGRYRVIHGGATSIHLNSYFAPFIGDPRLTGIERILDVRDGELEVAARAGEGLRVAGTLRAEIRYPRGRATVDLELRYDLRLAPGTRVTPPRTARVVSGTAVLLG